jgi:hypothetical protein
VIELLLRQPTQMRPAPMLAAAKDPPMAQQKRQPSRASGSFNLHTDNRGDGFALFCRPRDANVSVGYPVAPSSRGPEAFHRADFWRW